jgi:hypothetical protein
MAFYMKARRIVNALHPRTPPAPNNAIVRLCFSGGPNPQKQSLSPLQCGRDDGLSTPGTMASSSPCLLSTFANSRRLISLTSTSRDSSF